MRHPSDDRLLLAAAGEGEAAEGVHLAECAECQARVCELEGRLAGVAEWERAGEPGGAAGARARLELAMVVRPERRESRVARWAALAAGILLSCGLGWWWSQGRMDGPEPDRALTPGLASGVGPVALCGGGVDAVEVPAEMAAEVFRRYKIDAPPPGAYEVDFLIAPDLGGALDVRNLWPQPYRNGPWTAHVKDALEEYLRGEVCAGRMRLEAAQAEIAGDWVGSYRRHFGTARPLEEHVAYLRDRPWR